MVLNLLNRFRRQVKECAIAQMPEIHAIEEPIKQVGTGGDSRAEMVKRVFHSRGIATAHDDHDVIIIAEFGQISLPALLIILARIDKVAALGAEFQIGIESVSRDAASQ